jgi:hypothetical protein
LTAQARIVEINFTIMQHQGRIAGSEAERKMLEDMLLLGRLMYRYSGNETGPWLLVIIEIAHVF